MTEQMTTRPFFCQGTGGVGMPPASTLPSDLHTRTDLTPRVAASTKVGNRLPGALLTHMLGYTPHIPTIMAAAASPKLRCAREEIAGVRVQHGEKHRGDLYLCSDPETGNKYHRLEGVLEHLVADLQFSGWWIGRRHLPYGRTETDADVAAARAAGQQHLQQAYVIPLEVDVKRVQNAYDEAHLTATLTSLLMMLGRPPFQAPQVHGREGDVTFSCLRSLILSERHLPFGDRALEPLLMRLPYLTKLESFSTSLCDIGAAMSNSLQVLKLRNGQFTNLESLRGLRQLRSLELSRCAALQDVSALAHLTALEELSISNSHDVSMQCCFGSCTALRSVALLWCSRVTQLSAVLEAPKLTKLDVRYCNVEDMAALLSGVPNPIPTPVVVGGGDAVPRTAVAHLRTLSLVGCMNVQLVLQSLITGSRGEARGDADGMAPPLCTYLEHMDLSECGIDDAALRWFVRHCPRIRSLRVRENREVRSLSALSSVADTIESVDASYTEVSDIAGLSGCARLRSVRLRDCFRLTSIAPLVDLVETLEEVDASTAAQPHTWHRSTTSLQNGTSTLDGLLLTGERSPLRSSSNSLKLKGAASPSASAGAAVQSESLRSSASVALGSVAEAAAAERDELLRFLQAPLNRQAAQAHTIAIW